MAALHSNEWRIAPGREPRMRNFFPASSAVAQLLLSCYIPGKLQKHPIARYRRNHLIVKKNKVFLSKIFRDSHIYKFQNNFTKLF
jgi:hypothetical protein